MAFKTTVAPVSTFGKISPRSLGYSLQPGIGIVTRPSPIISTFGTPTSPQPGHLLWGGATFPGGSQGGPGMTVASYQPVSTSPSPVGPATNKLSGLIHGLFK